MTLNELKTTISEFREKVQAYRDLMAKSRDRFRPKIVRNSQQIVQMRSELNAEYGRLERYIKIFGNNPEMNDGVKPVVYPAYSNAFSNGILIRVGHSTDTVLQDLDYIIGKLNGMSEDEFREALQPRQENAPVSSINYWHRTNLLGRPWEFVKWIWQHKPIAVIITIVGLLAIDYSLAWQNVIWLKDLFLRIFR